MPSTSQPGVGCLGVCVVPCSAAVSREPGKGKLENYCGGGPKSLKCNKLKRCVRVRRR